MLFRGHLALTRWAGRHSCAACWLAGTRRLTQCQHGLTDFWSAEQSDDHILQPERAPDPETWRTQMMWRGEPHSRWHCRGYSLAVWHCRMGNACLLNSFLRQPSTHENIWPPWASKNISEVPSPRPRLTEISFQMQMNGITLYYKVNGSMASSILSQHSVLVPAFPWVYIWSRFFCSPVLFAILHGDNSN